MTDPSEAGFDIRNLSHQDESQVPSDHDDDEDAADYDDDDDPAPLQQFSGSDFGTLEWWAHT